MNAKVCPALWIVAVATATLLVFGCGKKEESPEAAISQVDTNAAQAMQPAPAAEPVPVAAPASQAEVTRRFKQMDQAMKRKNYEAAAQNLIAIQLSNVKMTEQQGFDQINRMRELSRKIADDAASGDPNAQRAAELFRQYQSMRTGR